MRGLNPCLGASLEKRGYPTRVTAVRFPFVPSTKQLLAYAESRKHKVYTNHKTKNPTFDEQALEWMMQRYPEDPVYGLVDAYREAEKLEGTYIDGKGFTVAADGRVHPIFNHNPSTFRLGAENPPVHQIPTTLDKESLYQHVRNLFVAAPGCVLGARDYSGIEARMVGYLAGDKDYLRLTGLGVHDFFLSHVLGRPADLKWSDEELKGYFKELKAAEPLKRDRCKRVIHGSNYVGSAFALYLKNRDGFENLKQVERYQREYFELFPAIPKWHANTLEEAERLGYLRCPDGFIHRFWRVYEYEREDGKWIRKPGADAKRAIAFRPQHMAFVYMAESLIALPEWVVPFLRMTIHDEIFWECAKGLQEKVDATVKAVMERPCRYLPLNPSWGLGSHLAVVTEGKSGARWGEMR